MKLSSDLRIRAAGIMGRRDSFRRIRSDAHRRRTARAWLTTTGGAEPDRTTGAAGTGDSMSDFMQRAQEALTNEGNRWTPEEGAVLAGTLVRIRQIEGQWGNFRVAVIRPLKGGVPVEVAEKTALKEALDEMEKHGPGCQVALKFLGRRQTKSGSGQQYEAYTSYIEPEESVAAVTAAAVERAASTGRTARTGGR